jgi:putative ABC transport system permease protein
LPIEFGKEEHGNPNAGVIARLKPGASLTEAQTQLDAACLRLQQEFPATNRGLSAQLSSLREQTVRQTNTPLFALLAATGLIVLLTCANIASLLLARGESKSAELGIRMALGGTASRIARLPILQSILLCGCGGLLGVPFAIASVQVLLRLAPVDVAPGDRINVCVRPSTWLTRFGVRFYRLSGVCLAIHAAGVRSSSC